ncbi:hypothetical protein FDU21_05000 [Xanthomonas oryzae pv. oryzae]|nr:hypothetical protein FDU21_05000 [Xanthomonas oryzae pv. oryzae]
MRDSANKEDNPSERCVKVAFEASRKPAPIKFPSSVNGVRRFAGDCFSKIDSCLGALQIVDDNRLLGAHFSMFASGAPYDVEKFNEMMASAGFQVDLPILYFGGGVGDWRQGLGFNNYMGVASFSLL